MSRKFEEIDMELVKLFQTDEQSVPIKEAVCRKFKYLDSPLEQSVKRRYCSYSSENGICRMCSPFTCIYRGYFTPRRKCDYEKIKSDIDKIISDSGDTALVRMWKKYKRRLHVGTRKTDLPTSAHHKRAAGDEQERL